MIQIAKDVFQIPVTPRQLVNTYLIGSTLIDAASSFRGEPFCVNLEIVS